MKRVLFVEDDFAHGAYYVQALKLKGLDVVSRDTAGGAYETFRQHDFDLVVIDIMMPPDQRYGELETERGMLTGLYLAKDLKKLRPNVPLVALSNIREDFADSLEDKRLFDRIFRKAEMSPRELAEHVAPLAEGEKPMPKAFIVHGHDRALLLECKNYLQNVIRLPEPIVLSERASSGRTVIEKFEHYASQADVVFVLASPDDTVFGSGDSQTTHRARQNVIFEYGYFMGAMRRLSGRIVLLYKGTLELPSDVAGVIYIDVSNGMSAASDQIRRELAVLGIQ